MILAPRSRLLPCSSFHRPVKLICVRFPEPLLGLFFPAQRYMRRRRDEVRAEFRRRYGLAEPEPLPPEDDGQAGPDEAAMRAWVHAARDHRLATIGSIARDQDELLRSKADELERTGAAELITAAGEIRARIIRFRWGADVIEITRSKGAEQRGWSRSLLPRSPAPDRAEDISHHLAAGLAALQPAPPPPPGMARKR